MQRHAYIYPQPPIPTTHPTVSSFFFSAPLSTTHCCPSLLFGSASLAPPLLHNAPTREQVGLGANNTCTPRPHTHRHTNRSSHPLPPILHETSVLSALSCYLTLSSAFPILLSHIDIQIVNSNWPIQSDLNGEVSPGSQVEQVGVGFWK